MEAELQAWILRDLERIQRQFLLRRRSCKLKGVNADGGNLGRVLGGKEGFSKWVQLDVILSFSVGLAQTHSFAVLLSMSDKTSFSTMQR